VAAAEGQVIAATYALPDLIVFVVAAMLILTGALGVISARNPVHSALCLIMTFFGIALAFVQQQAHFLAAVEIIVYAGAIVVLFLFVIMFLGVDRSEDVSVEPLVGQRPLAAVGVVITVAGIVTMLGHAKWVTGATATSTGGVPTQGGSANIEELGRSVFTTYLYAFEITSALLIIAVVGAVMLARRERITQIEEDTDLEQEIS
jgi:NADH-quinone oxidoreductase subunit J